MKYLVYLAVAALVVWAVCYVARRIARQVKGDCGCGGGCEGCAHRCGCKDKEG